MNWDDYGSPGMRALAFFFLGLAAVIAVAPAQAHSTGSIEADPAPYSDCPWSDHWPDYRLDSGSYIPGSGRRPGFLRVRIYNTHPSYTMDAPYNLVVIDPDAPFDHNRVDAYDPEGNPTYQITTGIPANSWRGYNVYLTGNHGGKPDRLELRGCVGDG